MYDGKAAGAAGSAESIQILARQAGLVIAAFIGINAWYLQAAAWLWAVGLASAYLLFNLVHSRRNPPPSMFELLVNITICTGLTLTQAEYSAVLYHLLFLRVALRAGRKRVARLALFIAGLYLAASILTVSITPAVAARLAYDLLAIALLAYAVVYIDSRFSKQASDDKQMIELIRQNDRNYRMALTDSLTGLYNHRAYKERIDGLAQYVLLIVDIDHFKKLNDTYGHLVGDKVLVGLGNIIKLSVRSGDLAFRYGGEEFVVVLPGTTAQIGLKIAERLRQKVAEWDFDSGNGRVPVTVSIGMTVKKPGMSSQAVFEQADQALYRAKQSGRNNVQAYVRPEPVAKYGM